jgi:hypothetical protein
MFYVHLVYFLVILVYFSRFGILCQEKSGNTVLIFRAKPRRCQARAQKTITCEKQLNFHVNVISSKNAFQESALWPIR